MQAVNYVAGHTKACNKHSRATLNNQINIAFKRVGKRSQQVHTKCLIRQLLYASNFVFQFTSLHGACTKGAKPACLRNCCNQTVIRHATHARKHDGKFNVEHVG